LRPRSELTSSVNYVALGSTTNHICTSDLRAGCQQSIAACSNLPLCSTNTFPRLGACCGFLPLVLVLKLTTDAQTAGPESRSSSGVQGRNSRWKNPGASRLLLVMRRPPKQFSASLFLAYSTAYESMGFHAQHSRKPHSGLYYRVTRSSYTTMGSNFTLDSLSPTISYSSVEDWSQFANSPPRKPFHLRSLFAGYLTKPAQKLMAHRYLFLSSVPTCGLLGTQTTTTTPSALTAHTKTWVVINLELCTPTSNWPTKTHFMSLY
jgi:hypothetical protein